MPAAHILPLYPAHHSLRRRTRREEREVGRRVAGERIDPSVVGGGDVGGEVRGEVGGGEGKDLLMASTAASSAGMAPSNAA